MKEVIKNIFNKAKQNTFFRRVLETGGHTQIVLMSVLPGEDIGEEVHEKEDQVLFLVEGEGEVVLNDKKKLYKEGDIVLVHAGTKHNFINTGSKDLKIITTYSPPHHPAGTIHKIKKEAKEVNY